VKITGPGRTETSPLRKGARASASGSGVFSVAETSEAGKAASLTGSGPIAAVETILALQGVEESLDERAKSVMHGEQLLKLLDELRDGILAGGIPRATLSRLATAVERRRDGFSDPKLRNILDEIDLRARVELAKLEQKDAQGLPPAA